MPAAGHAAAALEAAGALRARAAEVRVGHRLARRLGAVGPKNTPTGVGTKVSPTPMSSATSFMMRSASVNVGLVDDAEHPLGLVVVRRQLGAPVGDVRPLRVVEERLRRHVERVGVVQRPAAHPGAGQDHHVAQQVDALDAVAAQLRRPQELAQVPGRLGELVVGEAPAGLEHADAVALLGQPQRGDAAAETRTDDQDVVVRLHRTSMTPAEQTQNPPTRRCFSSFCVCSRQHLASMFRDVCSTGV